MIDLDELIAEARKCAPGDDATELAVIVHRLADALEAVTRQPSEDDRDAAFESGMDAVDWGMVRDGVGDPQEAASIAVRAALAAADAHLPSVEEIADEIANAWDGHEINVREAARAVRSLFG